LDPRFGETKSSKGSKSELEKFGLKFSSPPSPLPKEGRLEPRETDRDELKEALADETEWHLFKRCDGCLASGDDPVTECALTNVLLPGIDGAAVEQSLLEKFGLRLVTELELLDILFHSCSSSSLSSCFGVWGKGEAKLGLAEIGNDAAPPVLDRLGMLTLVRLTPPAASLPRRE
jgi:hypothetical protein